MKTLLFLLGTCFVAKAIYHFVSIYNFYKFFLYFNPLILFFYTIIILFRSDFLLYILGKKQRKQKTTFVIKPIWKSKWTLENFWKFSFCVENEVSCSRLRAFIRYWEILWFCFEGFLICLDFCQMGQILFGTSRLLGIKSKLSWRFLFNLW